MLAVVLVAPLNHLLAQAEWARRRLKPHAGQIAEFQLPMGSARLRVGDDGFLAAATEEALPELTLTIPSDTLLGSLSGADTAMRHVRIAGNAEFGESLGFVLRHLEWDAEGDLARVVGDIAAPRIHRAFSSFLGWHLDALHRAKENLRDYLVYEQPALVDASSHQRFSSDLITLADDLARLDKRIARLDATARQAPPRARRLDRPS